MSLLDPADLLKRLGDLPALPQALTDLLTALDREHVAIDELAATLSHDQALAAKTLRLANSSFYGLSGRVNSIRDAIGVLGLRSLGTALTAAAVAGRFARPQCKGFELAAYWRHSIACGLCTRQLARNLRLDGNAAFTAGLLHDLGHLVLASHLPEAQATVYALRAERDCQLLHAERELLGTDHAVIGALVAQRWHFGSDVVAAIRHHHEPPVAAAPGLVDLVHVANGFVHAVDLAGLSDEMVPDISAESWNRLALTQAQCEAALAATEAELDDLCRALGV